MPKIKNTSSITRNVPAPNAVVADASPLSRGRSISFLPGQITDVNPANFTFLQKQPLYQHYVKKGDLKVMSAPAKLNTAKPKRKAKGDDS